MIKAPPLSLSLFLILPLSGCLTVAEKEYHFTLLTDTSGTATIRFVDIGSQSEDTTDASGADFAHLIEFYLQGNQFEEQNPGFRDIRKRLYVDDGKLIGEISFAFDNLETVKLFRFDDDSPYMYYVGTDFFAEELAETNGKFNRELMPVIFWSRGTDDFTIRTRVSSETPDRKSLVGHFQMWESEQSDVRQKREN
jgi:hypothetical protein